MEIRVKKEDLKKAIVATKKALSTVIIQEERGHLLFSVTGSEMVVQGTNNDLKARCAVTVDNIDSQNFGFTADPKIIEKLLTKIDLDLIRIQFNPDEYVIKIFTTESERSFSSLQSFPADKMLTFENPVQAEHTEHIIDKEVILFTLNYSSNFLAARKDDQKQFDFIVIDKGIVYAANGANKMGFIVFKAFSGVENFKIRKLIVPAFINFIKESQDKDIKLIESKKDIGLCSLDGKVCFTCLKSNVDAPNIPKELIVSDGPYIKIDKDELIKAIDRLMVSNTSKTNSGIEILLTGKGTDSALQISLVSSLKNTENYPCSRINDEEADDITRVVDYKIFRAILKSFSSSSEVRLHLKGSNKGFKVYNGGEVNGNKYILVGIGSYAIVIRQ